MCLQDKAMTAKEAPAKWTGGEVRGESKLSYVIELYYQTTPIEKMDASMSTLTNCELGAAKMVVTDSCQVVLHCTKSLSTNYIEKITNLNGLKNLRILSLGRNHVKALSGLEAVGDTLEELWISYNLIWKLKGIECMKNLKVLYMSNNLVKEWVEFVKLAVLPRLADLVFVGNPLEEKQSAEGTWMDEATKRLPHLKKLDGTPVIK